MGNGVGVGVGLKGFTPLHDIFICSSMGKEFTFNGCLIMWVLVEDFNLFLPVKLSSPVGDHSLQIVGVETVVEGSPFQWFCVAGLIKTLVQILERTERERVSTKNTFKSEAS